jgi:hypothetical protein
MFNKIMDSFEKKIKTAGLDLPLQEQLALLIEGKLDWIRVGEHVVTVKPEDAELFLEHSRDFNIKSIKEWNTRLSNIKRLVETVENERRQKLEETESAMFDMVTNLKYLPGVEKVLSANGTVDGFEATVMSTHGMKYRFRITQLDAAPMEEDAEGVKGGQNREAVIAMRKAATTMIAMGVGRDEETARLRLQTIGLNYGLKPAEAVEIARRIFADEMGARRDFLGDR